MPLLKNNAKDFFLVSPVSGSFKVITIPSFSLPRGTILKSVICISESENGLIPVVEFLIVLRYRMYPFKHVVAYNYLAPPNGICGLVIVGESIPTITITIFIEERALIV